MKTRLIWALLAVAALITGLVLAVFGRDWIRDSVVVPVAFFFWVMGLLLQSIPQDVYWVGLIILSVLISAVILRPDSEFDLRPSATPVAATRSRLTQWLAYYSNIEESRFIAETLARDLARLTVQILSYHQGLSSDEVYERIDRGEITLPEDFLAFLRKRDFVFRPKIRSAWLDYLSQFIPRKIYYHSADQLTPIELEANQVLDHIETLLNPPESQPEAIIEQPNAHHADS